MADEKIPQGTESEFQKQLRSLKERRFDPGRNVELPIPILLLKNVGICTAGNISNIQGQAKSAKSSVMGAAIAAVLRNLLGKPECLEDTLGFGSKLPPNNDKQRRHILHFDTEQSPYHHHKLCMDVMARAGVTPEEYDQVPYHSYTLVSTDHALRRKMIERLVAEFRENQQSLACLFLDGVADIISDPNNAEESFDVVDWLHRLSATHQCAVITILHENPGDDGKARGHLGSQIIRKSETNLRVRKGPKRGKDGGKKGDENVSLIWVERARGADIAEEDGVKISWCESKKRHTIHDPSKSPKKMEIKDSAATEPRSAPLTKEQQRIKDWLEKTALKQPQKRKQLLELITSKLGCSPRTATNRIDEWIKRGWIHKRPGTGSSPYALGPLPNDLPKVEIEPPPKPTKDRKNKPAKKRGTKKQTAKKSPKSIAKKTTKKITPKNNQKRA